MNDGKIGLFLVEQPKYTPFDVFIIIGVLAFAFMSGVAFCTWLSAGDLTPHGKVVDCRPCEDGKNEL